MSPDPKMSERPEVREVKDAAGTRGIEIAFTVEAAAEKVLLALWDLKNFPRLFPDVLETRVLSHSEDTLEVAYRVDAVLREVRYTLSRKLLRPQGEIRWHQIKGDLKKVSGAWKVEPGDTPDRCRLTYRTFVDVGFFVPTVLVQKMAYKKADEMVERVRRVLRELCAASA